MLVVFSVAYGGGQNKSIFFLYFFKGPRGPIGDPGTNGSTGMIGDFVSYYFQLYIRIADFLKRSILTH